MDYLYLAKKASTKDVCIMYLNKIERLQSNFKVNHDYMMKNINRFLMHSWEYSYFLLVINNPVEICMNELKEFCDCKKQ